MKASMKTVHVIINAGAGAGHDDERATELRTKLEAAGLDAELTMAAGGEELIAAARRAREGGARLVVAGGGDGSVNAVASQLVDLDGDGVPGHGIRFGVLPMGTLNHFAKDLGIPLELDAAIANLVSGVPVRVDVGQVNDRIFLNNSSLGLYPDIVRDRETQQRRLGRGKWPAAVWASLAALRRYPFLSMRLDVEGRHLARRTPFVFIGNNAYTMQGLAIGARERLDGGTLSLYVAQRPTRFGLLRFAFDALRGRLGDERDFDVLHAAGFEIDTHRTRVRVATVMAPPLRYRSRPGALEVLVPAIDNKTQDT
jgi:diacylglycerol kinase family enzyme